MQSIDFCYFSGQEPQLENQDPHLIAGLLKAYFIELKEPLLTFELYDTFIEAIGTYFSKFTILSSQQGR